MTEVWADRSDCLMHYGVKGQKWGIRRFQNPDGTLTEAGKRRYDYLNRVVDKQYDRATRGARRTLEKNEGLTSAKARLLSAKAMAKMEYQEGLLKQKKKEIDEGMTFFERQLSDARWAGQTLFGLPGSLVASGIVYFDPDNAESVSVRSDLALNYRQQLNQARDTYRRETRG